MRDENSRDISTVSLNVAIESERVFASLGVSFQILSDGFIAERFKRRTAEGEVLFAGRKLVEVPHLPQVRRRQISHQTLLS